MFQINRKMLITIWFRLIKYSKSIGKCWIQSDFGWVNRNQKYIFQWVKQNWMRWTKLRFSNQTEILQVPEHSSNIKYNLISVDLTEMKSIFLYATAELLVRGHLTQFRNKVRLSQSVSVPFSTCSLTYNHLCALLPWCLRGFSRIVGGHLRALLNQPKQMKSIFLYARSRIVRMRSPRTILRQS